MHKKKTRYKWGNIRYHGIMFLHNTLCKLVCPFGIEGNAILVVAAEENALPPMVLKPSKDALGRKYTLACIGLRPLPEDIYTLCHVGLQHSCRKSCGPRKTQEAGCWGKPACGPGCTLEAFDKSLP